MRDSYAYPRKPGEPDENYGERLHHIIEDYARNTPTCDNVARWVISASPSGVREVTIRDMLGYNREGLGIVEIDLHWSWWRRPWLRRAERREVVCRAVHGEVLARLPLNVELRVRSA